MLNFKDWEKVSEDKKTTTLKHKKGHMMTLAHSKLPKIQQEALKRLKMAEGGQVGDPNKMQSAQDSMRKSFGYADGGDVQSDDKAKSPVTVNVGSPPQMPAPAQSAQPVQVQVPNAPEFQSALLPDKSMNAPASAQAGEQSAKLGADIEAAKAGAAVPQEQQYLNQSQNLNQYDQNTINNLAQKAKDLDDYQKQNPLKENAYIENMGAGAKIGKAIGLILSGAGTGVTGGTDPALDFLNKQIDRNIQAQKDRFGQKNTIYSAYKDLYGNEVAASNMARVHQLDFLNHQFALTAAQMGTPIAKQRLLEIQSKIIPEKNRLIMDSAGRLSSTVNNPKGDIGAGGNQPAPVPSVQPQQNNGPQAQHYSPEPQSGNMMSSYAHDIFGLRNSEAQKNPSSQKQEKPVIYPVLNHDADAILYGKLQQGTPYDKANYQDAKDQLASARQVEKVLNGPKGDGVGGIHEIFQDMYKAAGSGHGIGGSGDALQRKLHVTAFGHSYGVPALSEAGKFYENQQSKLKTDLASALKGLISVNDLDDMVDKFAPGYNDSPELVKSKEANFSQSLIKALKTNQLEHYKMIK